MATGNPNVNVRITADASQFNQTMAQVKKSVDTLGLAAGTAIGSAITSAGLAIISQVHTLIREAVSILDEAKRLNLPASKYYGVASAFERSGYGRSDAAQSLAALEQARAGALTRDPKYLEAFGRLGVNYSGQTQDIFRQTVAALSKGRITDERQEAAKVLLGSQSQNVINASRNGLGYELDQSSWVWKIPGANRLTATARNVAQALSWLPQNSEQVLQSDYQLKRREDSRKQEAKTAFEAYQFVLGQMSAEERITAAIERRKELQAQLRGGGPRGPIMSSIMETLTSEYQAREEQDRAYLKQFKNFPGAKGPNDDSQEGLLRQIRDIGLKMSQDVNAAL